MLLNAYLLYKDHTTEKKKNRLQFQMHTIEALITRNPEPEAGTSGVCPVGTGEKDCCVCSNRKIPGGR